MKKLLAICVILALVAATSVTAFAVGGFVSSPSANQAPTLVSYENESEECPAKLVITPYADKAELPAETLKKLEEAYDILLNTPDLSKLNAKLADIAKNKGTSAAFLAVSDLFDISYYGCDDHEDHGHFDIVLKPDSLKNFVALLHYYNNEWRIVDDAKITNNGTHLEFDEKEFSPFAIVVNTGSENVETPQTGDNSKIFIYVAVMVVSAAVLVFLICKKSKKRDA